MSIKFPDMQVLLGRSEQIPKIAREGDPTLAGRIAPEITEERRKALKKVKDSPKSAHLKNNKQKERTKKKHPQDHKGESVDIKA